MTGALPSPARRIVGFLRHNFLPESETFIYTSLRALEGWTPTVFALRRQYDKKFPFDDVTRPGFFGELCYRATTWCPSFFAWARKVDVLHAHFGYTGAHALWASRKLGKPLVTSYYGYDVTMRGGWDPTFWHYGALRRRLFRRGDRFLVLSEQMKRALAAQGCPEEKIRIVHLGVDLSRFGEVGALRGGSELRVLMVGREVEKKGFDDGLRACAAARTAGVPVHVTVLGAHGPLEPELRQLGDQLDLNVAWPDPSNRVPAAMAQADVLLVPSRTARNGDREGTPTVICEGGAAGLPIVSTDHAGIPEQVADGVTGFLVAERDSEGMAERLVRLWKDRDLRGSIGAAGRDKMQREFSIEAHRAALQAVYDEVSR